MKNDPADGRHGWALWESREGMRVMAVVGPMPAVLLLAYGIYLLATWGKGGAVVAGIGGPLLLYWVVMLPLARRGKKI